MSLRAKPKRRPLTLWNHCPHITKPLEKSGSIDPVKRTAVIQLEPSWKEALTSAFEQPYFQALTQRLKAEKAAGKRIYPPGPLIFEAFRLTPLPQVKVVILGQDPYHGAGQAHGLCFSVPAGVPIPPSLQNIYRELQSDIGCTPPGHGTLTAWAHQGVLLLNATLTVEAGRAGSHQGWGWEQFTDAAIRAVTEHHPQGVVFMLWGRYAQQKAASVDAARHSVLKAPHPSPLAGNAFLGCRHFSAANQWLAARGHAPVNWQLPPQG